jgi:hypothetical protein
MKPAINEILATTIILKSLHAAIFLSVAIVVIAAGCNHSRSTPEDTTVSHEVSQALVGRQVTIRGKFSSQVKADPYVVLDNQQEVWIGPRESELEDTYARLDGKLVEATGSLRFYHNPAPVDETTQREPDHFYFEARTTQLRLVNH